MRRLVALGSMLALAAVAAGARPPAAAAADECRGLPVCLPLAGAWVVVPPGGQAVWQLTCPRRGYIVAGTDARVGDPAVDVFFRAETGSPVSPGVSTRASALFTGLSTRVGRPRATYRPFIGCVPTSGGGSRSQTIHVPRRLSAVAPVEPIVRRVTTLRLRPGAEGIAIARCARGERLLGADHAAGLRTQAEPDPGLLGSVSMARAIQGTTVRVVARFSDDVPARLQAEVQAHAICVKGRPR